MKRNVFPFLKNTLTTQNCGESPLEPFNDGNIGLDISSSMIMEMSGNTLLPSNMTSTVHQHHIISNTSNLIGNFATQLAAAAAVVGTIPGSTEIGENGQLLWFKENKKKFFLVLYGKSSHPQQQNSLPLLSQINNDIDEASASMIAPSLIDINRSAVGLSLTSQHHHNRATPMFGFGSKSVMREMRNRYFINLDLSHLISLLYYFPSL
jgi:hypothetical protein